MICVVGSGFSGSVIAHKLAIAGYDVCVVESRDHIGGNCYTRVDQGTNVIEHVYGPHIFHTANKAVWDFVTQFESFIPYRHAVRANLRGQIYSLPINLHTISQFTGKAWRPSEARDFFARQGQAVSAASNFDEAGRAALGDDLYEAFFAGYTQKQWGVDPKLLPKSLFSRLPLRFNYDDNYFFHPYQGLPERGYTPIFEKLLDHPRIDVKLNQGFERVDAESFDACFYSGAIDSYFDYVYGHMPYRTLDFVRKKFEVDDYQGCAVVNYPDSQVPYTRVTEHKHFAPWRETRGTIVYEEYSRSAEINDVRYYPVNLAEGNDLRDRYAALAKMEKNVVFVGRLGTFRYLDMDVCIAEALKVVETWLSDRNHG